jgi:citrate synthase
MLIKSMSYSERMDRMLESDEAARRLGVKVTTLYAYVSRGLLVSRPAPSGRRSLFDLDEVERLARRSRQGKTVETRMATVTTSVTHLTEHGPLYRGRRATDLATTASFEEVADLLWDVPVDLVGSAAPSSSVGTTSDPAWQPLPLGLPPDFAASDRMRWAVVMAGALDPLRADLRPPSVTRTARRVAASMVEVLAVPDVRSGGTGPVAIGRTGAPSHPLILSDGPVRPDSLAERLTARLSPAPTGDLVRGVNAALVLMADHELATSTMAVRVAASTRADVYDVLLAGLGTIAGPLHGGASQQAYALLIDARRLGVERALNETLRWRGLLPGFGHTVYKDGDPRFAVLFDLFERMGRQEDVLLVRSLVDLAADRAIPSPNVDLALGAMAWATGMPQDAGQTLFAVARVAGWVAHYLEELGERPLRYRARAVYTSSSRPGGGDGA